MLWWPRARCQGTRKVERVCTNEDSQRRGTETGRLREEFS